MHAGIPPPQEQTPPRSRHPPGADTPLGADTHPSGSRHPPADSGIRSMSGRYASYWNTGMHSCLFCFDFIRFVYFYHPILVCFCMSTGVDGGRGEELGKGPMWPLPMMHWNSLYRPLVPPASDPTGSILVRSNVWRGYGGLN